MAEPKKQRSKIRADRYEYTVVFEQDPEGGYIVTVPALDGIATQGETLEEARAMAAEMVQGLLECTARD